MGVILSNATAPQVARTLAVVSRRKVVYCHSIGDAASAVVLLAGSYERNIGQCANYRHRIEDAASRHDALCAVGYWDRDSSWVMEIPDEHDVAVVDRLVRDGFAATTKAEKEAREAAEAQRLQAAQRRWDAEAPQRAEIAARLQAETEQRREALRPLYEAALARCRTKTNGQVHRGDVRAVETAYEMATKPNYAYDLAYWRRVLERLAAGEPATPAELNWA